MTDVRRAFLFASLGRYLTMAINLAATLVMARLLSPADYGIAVLGGSVFAVAEAVRAIGGGAYLVQEKDLTPVQIHSNFTISLIATVTLVATLTLLGRPLAFFFDRPELEAYLSVAAIGFLAGPINYQILALMSRNLVFGQISLITTVVATVNACVGVSLALLGCVYMSLAWASAISTFAATGLYLYFWRDWSIFRLTLREWRSVLAFSVHDSAFGILSQVSEAVPYLIIGRALDAGSVGLSQRAVLLAFFPERVILAGVSAVALPAFAQQARNGEALRTSYISALGLITAVQWPALITLALLAGPLVQVLLGSQWFGVAPVLQILASALVFSFPMALHYPTLVAVGAIRVVPITVMVQATITIVVLALAAPLGLKPLALSTLFIVPFCSLISLVVISRFLNFNWFELVVALAPSVLVAAACVAAPCAFIMVVGWEQPLSLPLAIVAGLLAGCGWIAGLWLTRHPLLKEMAMLSVKLKRRRAAR